MPDHSWLRCAGDRPVVAYRMDQHACVVNHPVLAMIEGAAVPDGGTIVRSDRGEPTGLLLEQAAWQLVNPIVPAPSVQERQNALRAACAHAASRGIVAVCSMEYAKDLREVFHPIRAELPIRVAITLLDRGDAFDPALAECVPSDDRLWVNGFKSFVDGTLGSRTARLLEPYADQPGERGMLMEEAARGTLREWAKTVIDAGFSPSMHAIGDEALRVALDAVEPIDPERIARFEHAQTIHPADLPRLRGRLVSMQPHHRTFDRHSVMARLGAGRLERFFPFRQAWDAGAMLGFGSDWPIVDLDPRKGMHEAIHGAGGPGGAAGDERLLEHEAMAAYTTQAWKLLRAGAMVEVP